MRWDKLVRGILTLGLVGVSCYQAIVGQEIPKWLLGLTMLAVGQYLPVPGTVGGGK